MTLSTLAEVFSVLVDFGNLRSPSDSSWVRREISSICFDSRKLQEGCVFVAIRGTKSDGHRFLPEAIAQGAIGIVVEDASLIPADYKGGVAIVRDSRQALNRMASHLYGEPGLKLFCVGVTGTNGKTTITYMTEAILNAAGLPTGVIGTINHHLGDRVWPTEMTTPDPISFQKRLSAFVGAGAKALALEVSSHALHQSRVDEVPFDVAIFTNLSRDHLDYHSDMEDYFRAKQKLFDTLLARSKKSPRFAVVNLDDTYGARLQASGGAELWTYGEAPAASLRIEVIEQGFAGTRFKLHVQSPSPSARAMKETHEFSIRMPGLHNVSNACGAIGAGLAAGLSLKSMSETLAKLSGVRGRLESVENKKNLHIFVDYAHTDGALEAVLHHLGKIRSQAGLANRIITVFGCGGDRDKGKRPLMMKAATRGSDLVVLTSDNPRTEDPEKILDDAVEGADHSLLGKTVFREVDRRKGIAKALELAKPGDVILVAGKGHEDYQQIGTVKHPFSDVEVVKEILK
jgi:UDP-N-acetylmuramoyl-L-alanyl-D-glutamate--2,6-diaminopimelate ligase